MKSVLKGFLARTQSPKRTTKQWFQLILGLVIVVAASGFFGGLMGYYAGTGEYPWVETIAVLPDNVQPETSLIDIGHFLETESVADIDYGYGYNCVEDAILLARNAVWQGLPAEPARLMFSDGTGHLVLIFPTMDGWVFVDSQKMEVINPVIGGMYMGNRITSIERLVLTWEPIKWEVK